MDHVYTELAKASAAGEKSVPARINRRSALATPPVYLGIIGSRRKRGLIIGSLMAEGVTTEDLRRVHCPVGPAVGVETPEEIAVSIGAEIIQVRVQAGRRPTAEIRR